MTEDEAQCWIEAQFGANARARLEEYASLLCVECERQNLIASSTLGDIWTRHIVDSAQLVALSERQGLWLDIGSGAGLPGIVVASCVNRPMILVEPRGLRAAFLSRAAAALGLQHVEVRSTKVERVSIDQSIETISARAVSRLGKLFTAAYHLTSAATEWILPKGAGAEIELAEAQRDWKGTFHVKQSLIDPGSKIVVATNVRPK